MSINSVGSQAPGLDSTLSNAESASNSALSTALSGATQSDGSINEAQVQQATNAMDQQQLSEMLASKKEQMDYDAAKQAINNAGS